MKKIIAAAVTAAFMAPVAYAADISVSGELEFQYRATDGADNLVRNDDNILVVSASSELANGMTIKGDLPFNLAGGSDGGESIDISGSGMKFGFGDVSGALDAVGDYSDVAPEAGGFAGDGNDATVYAQFSVGPATVTVSHSPKGDSVISGGVSDDFNSYSAKMALGAGEVYAGTETGDGVTDVTAYGIKQSVGGVMIAGEYADYDDGSSATGIALTYKMGDISLGMENQTVENTAGVNTTDMTVIFAKYSLGGGATAYIETMSNGLDAGVDQNTIGVAYSF